MPDQVSKSLKIRVRTARGPSRSPVSRGYRIRPTSFILSIGFHVAAVSAILLLPREPQTQAHYKPIYDDLVKPQEKKIVWYSPPRNNSRKYRHRRGSGRSPRHAPL